MCRDLKITWDGLRVLSVYQKADKLRQMPIGQRIFDGNSNDEKWNRVVSDCIM